MTIYNQHEFDIRCEWGEQGVSVLAPISDVVIIVDVLSFSTSVEIAASRGAWVYPYRWRDEAAQAYAASLGAELAGHRQSGARYSLSPQSLLEIPSGTRLVLPSPNGSTLSLAAGETPVLAGCLRNAAAVASAAAKYGSKIAVIPAGERWREDGSLHDGALRPAFEDLVSAGAILRHLDGSRSPEALAASAAFHAAQDELREHLKQCSSGKELIERDGEQDVLLASELEVSACVPVLEAKPVAVFRGIRI